MAATPNFRLTLIDFDTHPWDVYHNNNVRIIDGLIARYLSVNNLQGIWTNSTAYTSGQVTIDSADGSLWQCQVNNTSSATPTTFATERANHPTYWASAVTGLGTSVTNAANSAAAAATSASAASTSQTAAATSASSAQASLTSAIAAANAVGANTRPTVASASTTSLTVSPGSRVDSTGAAVITLASSITKTIAGAYVVGNNQPGMGTGLTVANNTTYHVFLATIAGTTDVFIDTSLTAANKPAGTTAFIRVMSFKTNGSAQIRGFKQYGQRVDFNDPTTEISGNLTDTIGHVSALPSLPTGLVLCARLSGSILDTTSAASIVYISATAQTDSGADDTHKTAQTGVANTSVTFYKEVMTDTSAQIRFRSQSTTMTIIFNISGFIDHTL